SLPASNPPSRRRRRSSPSRRWPGNSSLHPQDAATHVSQHTSASPCVAPHGDRALCSVQLSQPSRDAVPTRTGLVHQLSRSRVVSQLSHLLPSPEYLHARGRFRLIQQPDRTFDRRRTQVHVPLRRREVLVSSELLNGPCRRPTHHRLRTERVAKAM